MDDAQDIDGFLVYAKDGAVGTMKLMAIGGAELFVFRNQRAERGLPLVRRLKPARDSG